MFYFNWKIKNYHFYIDIPAYIKGKEVQDELNSITFTSILFGDKLIKTYIS
jgi:hypothetical protein